MLYLLRGKSSTKMDRSGFSLIELMVVLLLISIVTASVSIRWADIYQRAKFRPEVEKVIEADFKARRHAANRHRACKLVFDFDAQKVSSSRWVEGRETFVSQSLKQGTRITGIRTIQNSTTTGVETLPVSNNGATATYALELSQNGQQKWILFAGRTGQTKLLDEAKPIDAIFNSLRVEGTAQ